MPTDGQGLGGYAVIPLDYLAHHDDLSGRAKMVLVVLSAYEGRSPSHGDLAKLSGMSVSTVQRGLTELRDAGLVTWRHVANEAGGKAANLYDLVRPAVAVIDDETPSVNMTDTPIGQPDRSLTRSSLTDRTSSSKDDDGGVVNSLRESRARPKRSWEPHPSARARAESIANLWDVDNHIDRYILRCRDREKRPSDGEWLRWLIDDEHEAAMQLLKADREAANEGMDDETGTPRSWSKRERSST